MTRKTVIVVTKDAESRGGVANYFRLFFQKYNDPVIQLERQNIGSRSHHYYKKTIAQFNYLFTYITDLIRLTIVILRDPRNTLLHLNPSLIPVPLIRDGIILFMAKILGIKVLVFFRGWDDKTVAFLEESFLFRRLFQVTYQLADHTLVLAHHFRSSLLKWNFLATRVSVTTTMFDGNLVQDCYPNKGPFVRFLFLSRITREKGVFEIVHAAHLLNIKHFLFKIDIVGYPKDSFILQELTEACDTFKVTDFFSFKPFLDGPDKFNEYAKSDVFLFPSYHEGFPNSILEAMASGLFIISTKVGALGEIIREGVNGIFVRPGDPSDLANKMQWAIENIHKVRKLGKQNRRYAFDRFESKKVIHEIHGIYERLLYA